jgi:hypothetical protein
VSAFCSQVDDALEGASLKPVSDETLQRVLTAAVRLYAAKSEDRARELPPFGDKPVNATEAVDRDLRDHACGRYQLLRPADVVPARANE